MSSAAWSPSGDRLAYIYSGPRTPGEIWVWSEADDSLHRVVSDRPGRSLRRALVEPEVVEVDVPESDEALPAHLYRPAGATRPSRAVVWLREGPRGPWRNDWSPEIQAMVSSGAVVIAPRLPGRGGPGAGADRELAGIEGAVRYLETHDVVDPGCRIAIGGAGHGGLLALLAAAMDPARYQGVISISGWTDLLATHERASGHLRRAIEEDVGAPGEVPVAYADLSPSQHSSRIRCPVLLIAGTHDPLVPERDTRDLARRIRQAGNRVELVLLESAGSEARTQHQRRRHVREIRRFIEEEL